MVSSFKSIGGQPDFILSTHSLIGRGVRRISAAGHFSKPLITDVSGFEQSTGTFFKSYYSDKVFARFKSGSCPLVLTVPGQLREYAIHHHGGAFKYYRQRGEHFLEYV